MRCERLYLNDIVEAADHIAAFIAGADFEDFQKSEMMRSAAVQKLVIIGEAAARIPDPPADARPLGFASAAASAERPPGGRFVWRINWD